MSSKREPKPWLDEDIEERVAEQRECSLLRWNLLRGKSVVEVDPNGHLVVLHAETLLDMLDTIESLRKK